MPRGYNRPMHISLIATVLNEGKTIRGLLNSIAAQTCQPNEIIICDGGSSDETHSIIDEFTQILPLTVIQKPGTNISEGRNAAIGHASRELIAVTDAGVRLDPAWLEHLTRPFSDRPSVQVVSGFFQPDPSSAFELAMGATVLPALQDVNPATFMPSSRSVAFRRSAWEAVGGYPAWLDFCEDLVFDFRLRALYGPFAFAPGAVAYFRPRSNSLAFLRQYYQYARGDGKADLFFRRHLIRYVTYFVALPLVLLAGVLVSPWWLLLLVLGAIAVLATPYRRLVAQWKAFSIGEKAIAVLWVPVIRVAGDLAKMAGYPVGVLWRWRKRPPDWRLHPSQGDRTT